MNEGQKMFSEFIMKRVAEDRKSEAEKLLKDGFERQEAGKFDHAYIESFISSMLGMIRPDAREEVETVMMNYRNE